jgi:hypothetical protein
LSSAATFSTERRGATEGEAIAAERRVFRLLARYNLEISQIPDDEPTKPDTRIASESTERPSSPWKQIPLRRSPNLNFSECFTWRQKITVVGTRANRIATLEMAGYLIDTIERLANKEAAEVPGDERRRFHYSYTEGCATRIYRCLEQMRAEAEAGRMKAEDPNSLLPALADVYQANKARVDDFIADHFGKVCRRTHYNSGGHDSGYISGYNASGKVGLHRQLGRKHAPRRVFDIEPVANYPPKTPTNAAWLEAIERMAAKAKERERGSETVRSMARRAHNRVRRALSAVARRA